MVLQHSIIKYAVIIRFAKIKVVLIYKFRYYSLSLNQLPTSINSYSILEVQEEFRNNTLFNNLITNLDTLFFIDNTRKVDKYSQEFIQYIYKGIARTFFSSKIMR